MLHLLDATFSETSPRIVNGEVILTLNTCHEKLNAFTYKAPRSGLYFVTTELVI